MHDLIRRAQRGDRLALNRLFEREIPVLRRWGQTRVPAWLSRRVDVDDLVQQAAIKTLRRLPRLTVDEPRAFQAYLRTSFVNLMRDAIRKAGRDPATVSVDDAEPIYEWAAADELFARRLFAHYRAALGRLAKPDRAAVYHRCERGLSYAELARVLGKPTHGAARSAVGRALQRLTDEISRVQQKGRAHSRKRALSL